MVHSDKLSADEAAIYSSIVATFFNVHVDAEQAMETFSNPNIGANLKSAAAFIEAACTLIEYENDSRRIPNGNNQTSGNPAPTSQN